MKRGYAAQRGYAALRRVAEALDRIADSDAVTLTKGDVRAVLRLLEEAQLNSIEARNPGIDMDEVRRLRAQGASS